MGRSVAQRFEVGQGRLGWQAWVPALAAALVLLAWLPALAAPYQYDDFNTPVGDAASQSLADWWRLLPHTLRPLTKLSYALESTLGADSAGARRVLNALLFGGCVAWLKGLLEAADVPATLALLLASVWAVHPVHAETVVALAGRPVLLAMFFMLASAWSLVRGRANLALVSALLALFARESALPWLLACALLVAHERHVSVQRLIAAAVAALGAGVLVLASSSGVRRLVTSALSVTDAWDRLGLQWAAPTRGTWMLLTSPGAFTPDIEFAPSGMSRLALILGTIVLYGAALWLAYRYQRLRVFALLWLCFLLPQHSLIPKLDPLTARPFSASLAPLLALAAVAIAPRLARHPRLNAGASLVLAATFLLWFPLTRARAQLYRDPIALWRDAAERTERKLRPLVNLGTLLAHQHELSAAERAFERALQRDPTSFDVRLRLSAVRRLLLAQQTSESRDLVP